jgi:SSS family solute:Na+ symporter
MMNSISTIFTMDIYRDYLATQKTEQHYVTVGRITSLVSIVIAVFLARPFLGGMASAFQTIQEYTGYIAPGIVAVFLLGMFWKRCNSQGAFGMLVVSVGSNIMLKLATPDTPFVIRIWIVFLACIAAGYIISILTKEPEPGQPVDVSGISFESAALFNRMSIAIGVLLTGIYIFFW